MIRTKASTLPYNRSNGRRFIAFAAAAAAVFGLMAVIPLPQAFAAEERASGNWGTTFTGTNPKITNTRIDYNGPNFNIPLSNEVIAGKITTFSGQVSMKSKPSGTNWVVYLCADDANTQCANVSPTGSWVGSNTWPVSTNSAFAGFPAYTSFHYVFSLNDGGSGPIHPVLSPTLNPVSLTIQINYTY